MIFGSIFNMLFFVADFIIGLLPTADTGIVATISAYGTNFKSYFNTANWFFPVDQALIVLGLRVTIELVLLIVKLVRIVLNR